MTEPNPTHAVCARCKTTLTRQPCGCWTDPTTRGRWCRVNGTWELHEPQFGTQPETCEAKL